MSGYVVSVSARARACVCLFYVAVCAANTITSITVIRQNECSERENIISLFCHGRWIENGVGFSYVHDVKCRRRLLHSSAKNDVRELRFRFGSFRASYSVFSFCQFIFRVYKIICLILILTCPSPPCVLSVAPSLSISAPFTLCVIRVPPHPNTKTLYTFNGTFDYINNWMFVFVKFFLSYAARKREALKCTWINNNHRK